MRLFAPKIVILTVGFFFLGVLSSQAAPSCQSVETVGKESSARSWVSARRNARAKWVDAVNMKIGQRWSNWSFASKQSYMCWAYQNQKICKAVAIPCDGRMTSSTLSGQGSNAQNRDTQARQRAGDHDNFDKPKDKRALARAGYVDEQIADSTSRASFRCQGQTTRISGKLSYDLRQAKQSAYGLWSEYVGITKGQDWSVWGNAQRRHLKCVPAGLKIKCEVSAVACKPSGAFNNQRQVQKNRRNLNGRISLPMKRPNTGSFRDGAVEKPIEFGDGNGEGIALPEKRDGFALPWLSDQPVKRPEPEGGEAGPFGANDISQEFDISGVRKDQDRWPYEGKTSLNRKQKQGGKPPALPVQRPEFRQAARQDGRSSFQDGYEQEQLGRSGYRGLTLPEARPGHERSQQPATDRNRLSQDNNADIGQKWPFGDSGTGQKARQDSTQERGTSAFGADEDESSAVDRDKSRGSVGRSDQRNSTGGSNRNSAPKSLRNNNKNKRNRNSAQDNQAGNSKVFKGWVADQDGEDRSVPRARGRKKSIIASSRKFKKLKKAKQARNNSAVNYMSYSAIAKAPTTFYGCKEDEVATWGRAQPTKPQARQDAIKKWQKVIYKKFGKNWSDWMRAGSSRVQCGTHKGMRKCVAIANPCGEVPIKKKNEFSASARCRIYALTYWGEASRDLEQAKQNALNAWEKKVEKKYGSKWSDWFRSLEPKINCRRKTGRKSCKATAIPCSQS